MKNIDPKALFRLSVLGPLVSRERLERGELQQGIRELAQREYAIPDSKRRHRARKVGSSHTQPKPSEHSKTGRDCQINSLLTTG